MATEGGGYTLGALVMQLAVQRGFDLRFAGRCGVVLDALALAIDLADNLVDAEEDAAAGRPLDTTYPGLPMAVLVPLPALVVGSVVAALATNFPEPEFESRYATRRLLGVLDVLVRGQGRSMQDEQRVEEISAVQGLFYALPWWLSGGEKDPERIDLETWAKAFGRTWQARRDALENPRSQLLRARYDTARETARSLWLDGAPFEEGQMFDFASVVPELQ